MGWIGSKTQQNRIMKQEQAGVVIIKYNHPKTRNGNPNLKSYTLRFLRNKDRLTDNCNAVGSSFCWEFIPNAWRLTDNCNAVGSSFQMLGDLQIMLMLLGVQSKWLA